eukprot:CAMPEP_0204027398 /NCGR_PEP_ID=MMETSP0360-20130528/49058_1 /ASSEMBLY_ACC=CAM_ASM_000342 /TAXON_ID=268821 /ORGANISM="Scrippsiella Hangoei, Strain SHTV-5" /LENGTH=56 /DNA_ID=CAMNT_0050971103 /DNA_START=60 /DNA_END=227 /DNA_ORIENTATION=-
MSSLAIIFFNCFWMKLFNSLFAFDMPANAAGAAQKQRMKSSATDCTTKSLEPKWLE